ncbi:sensor histidine kinase [Paenibacillaceae bacterium]|nr:sensor histidine kinase [Paenibacillaceae bacterium]
MPKKKTLSFRNKLKYAFLGITMMAVLVTGGLSYSISASILEKNSLTLTQDSVNKSARIVDEKLSKLMLIMMTFMISEPFKDLLESVSSGDYGDYYKHLNNMDNVFSQARMAEPLIHSIYVSTPMGDFYPLSVNRNRAVTFRDTPMYQRMLEEQRNIWVEGHEDQLFTGKQRVVTLVLEPITDSTLFSLSDVYVVVNIRESGLRRLIEPESEGGATRFLVNSNAELVGLESNPLIKQAVDSGMIGEAIGNAEAGQTTRMLHDEDYLINFASLGLNDWKIVSIQSKNNVLKDLIYVKWMIAIIAVGCFAIAMLVSGGLIRYLLQPIKSLQSVMKRVESNDLTARFEVKSDDELAQIGTRFNRMLEQIIGLIDEVKEAEMTKRATEIKALSAQMDPHFLYNTLNTIYWKMKLKKTEESQHMVVSLSRLFQLGLNKGQEYTTLEKELLHVRQYLELQKYCYEELFDYEIEVDDPSLEQLRVPRIMLQPLVENSIIHGFGSMERGGHMRIAVHADRERGECRILVIDNGAGVDKETVNALLGQTTEKGYAIGNLLSRLRLYYGEEAGLLAIESEPGAGMTVAIVISLEGGMNDERTWTG